MIQIGQGDVTTLTVDAIVNAASQVMLGGGEVDATIQRHICHRDGCGRGFGSGRGG